MNRKYRSKSSTYDKKQSGAWGGGGGSGYMPRLIAGDGLLS